MLRSAALALGLLAVSPALADGLTITLRNQASQAVEVIDAFPVSGDDGTIIEDNLGGFFDALPAGETRKFSITGFCGLTYFRVGLADESQLEGRINTCTDRTILVSD